MGQLRTANKRHNRALTRARDVANETVTASEPSVDAKGGKA